MSEYDWRERFRAQQVWGAQLSGHPDRGLVVTSADGATIQQFAWDVSSGQLRALTDAPHGVVDGWIDPAGTYVYYLVDVLWPLLDPRRQALHDKFAGTCVVRPQR